MSLRSCCGCFRHPLGLLPRVRSRAFPRPTLFQCLPFTFPSPFLPTAQLRSAEPTMLAMAMTFCTRILKSWGRKIEQVRKGQGVLTVDTMLQRGPAHLQAHASVCERGCVSIVEDTPDSEVMGQNIKYGHEGQKLCRVCPHSKAGWLRDSVWSLCTGGKEEKRIACGRFRQHMPRNLSVTERSIKRLARCCCLCVVGSREM